MSIIPRKKLYIKKTPSLLGGTKSSSQLIDYIKLNDIDNTIIKTETDDYIFNFTEKNTSITDKSNKYFAKGGITAIYSIKLSENSENTIIPDKYKNNLILRIFGKNIEEGEVLPDITPFDINIGKKDFNNDSLTKFIQDIWTPQKKEFPENIIDLYMYGDIYIEDLTGVKYVGYYVLTREYINSNDIMKFTLTEKIYYFKTLLEFFVKLKEKNLIYRDFKFPNIGADKTDDNKLIFIVLDYDEDTLATNSQLDILHKYSIQHIYGGYIPLYILGITSTLNPLKYYLPNHDMMYSIGMLNVICLLFRKSTYNVSLNDYIEHLILFIDKLNFRYLMILVELLNEFIVTERDIKEIDDELKNEMLTRSEIKELKTEQYELRNENNIIIIRLNTVTVPGIIRLIENDDDYKYIVAKNLEETQLAEHESKLFKLIKEITSNFIKFTYAETTINLTEHIASLNEIVKSDDKFKEKYLKYKQKYINLKNKI